MAHAGLGANIAYGHVEAQLDDGFARRGFERDETVADFSGFGDIGAVGDQLVLVGRPARDADHELHGFDAFRHGDGELHVAIPREVGFLAHGDAVEERRVVGDELVGGDYALVFLHRVQVTVHGRDEAGDIGRAAGAAEPFGTVHEHVGTIRVVLGGYRVGFQRVHVVEVLAVQRDAGDGAVEDLLLQHVGVFALDGDIEHLTGKEAHADGCAGFAIHGVVRQIVVVGEGLADMGGADAAGDVHAAADDVLPQALCGVTQLLVVGQTRHVGHAGEHVGDAHGMAFRGLLLADGAGGLRVLMAPGEHLREDRGRAGLTGGLVLLVIEAWILATHVDEELGELQIPLFLGDLVQAGQSEFDFRVAVSSRNLTFAIAEVGIKAVGHLLGDFEGLLVAGDLVIGHTGLDVVPSHTFHGSAGSG